VMPHVDFVLHFFDEACSGRHHFSSAHFGVRPSPDRRPKSEPSRTFPSI
jgi:hypothetical protein